jgi:hypothetical protein
MNARSHNRKQKSTYYLTSGLALALLGAVNPAQSAESVATEIEAVESMELDSSDTYTEGGSADLAQELTNPLADIVSVPIQANFDNNLGVLDNGRQTRINIQPVIPFNLNDEWNLISRTIMPLIDQSDIFPGSGSQFGLGDTNLSLFLSPKDTEPGAITWGAGPIFLLPTATDNLLGADQWAMGPSAAALRISGPWTYGGLVNHVWSLGGAKGKPDINNTFVQPFVSYTTATAWGVSLQSEINYNWTAEAWSIPVNLAISKLVKFGKLPVSLQAGAGYWIETPDAGPEGFRYRLQANIVLPKW